MVHQILGFQLGLSCLERERRGGLELRSALRCLVAAFSSSLSFSISLSDPTGGQAANIYVYVVCAHMPSPFEPARATRKGLRSAKEERESEGGERTDE